MPYTRNLQVASELIKNRNLQYITSFSFLQDVFADIFKLFVNNYCLFRLFITVTAAITPAATAAAQTAPII